MMGHSSQPQLINEIVKVWNFLLQNGSCTLAILYVRFLANSCDDDVAKTS